MAGDWIKMRGALLDNPKVIAIGRELHRNKDFREWLTPGGSSDLNGQVIGDHALRCVTTALLMRVWSVSREHGKFVGDDLVLEFSSIDDLDQMAGAPGVGEAMKAVKWAIEENGVTLPNFKEFNVPMTPAEKQREYRTRNKMGNGSVTKTLPSDGNENKENVTTREEKRRSKKQDASPPNGGSTVWDFGKTLLCEQGLSLKSAGALIGQWLRDWDEPAVADALRAAAGKADVRAYVAATLNNKPRRAKAGGGLTVAL